MDAEWAQRFVKAFAAKMAEAGYPEEERGLAQTVLSDAWSGWLERERDDDCTPEEFADRYYYSLGDAGEVFY